MTLSDTWAPTRHLMTGVQIYLWGKVTVEAATRGKGRGSVRILMVKGMSVTPKSVRLSVVTETSV